MTAFVQKITKSGNRTAHLRKFETVIFKPELKTLFRSISR